MDPQMTNTSTAFMLLTLAPTLEIALKPPVVISEEKRLAEQHREFARTKHRQHSWQPKHQKYDSQPVTPTSRRYARG